MQAAKLVQPDVQPYPAWGVGGGYACWAWLCVLLPQSTITLYRPNGGSYIITQAPIAHTTGVWSEARANTWWRETSR